MKSAFLASLSRLSTDFTICCSGGGRGGGVLQNPGGERWAPHLDTGLIQFGHIEADNEIISRLVNRCRRQRCNILLQIGNEKCHNTLSRWKRCVTAVSRQEPQIGVGGAKKVVAGVCRMQLKSEE